MGVFSPGEGRALWPVAGLAVVLGLGLCGEILGIGVGVVTVPDGYITALVTSLVCLAGLLYGSYWVVTSELSTKRYSRLSRWCVGGLFIFLLVNLGFMLSIPPETSFQAATWARWAASIGGFTGFVVGLFEARAIEREVEAERRRLRQEEIRQERDQLEEFASIVSHDLRNPLNVATSRLTLAKEECDSDHLDDVEGALTRMNVLIEDLLTLARQGKEVTEFEPVKLERLVEACWANVETGDATLVTEIEGAILADGSRLRQVFENLLRNAIEHGGEDVTVTVGLLDDRDGFYVEDDGPGIPEDERGDVFEAGYSMSRDGTGFGLSIVEQIVEAHGWEIEVTDGADGGARFEITGVEFVTQPQQGAPNPVPTA